MSIILRDICHIIIILFINTVVEESLRDDPPWSSLSQGGMVHRLTVNSQNLREYASIN